MFTKGQVVRGVKCGRFVVVSTKPGTAAGEVVTVREIGPQGQVSRSTMRFPSSMLVADSEPWAYKPQSWVPGGIAR